MDLPGHEEGEVRLFECECDNGWDGPTCGNALACASSETISTAMRRAFYLTILPPPLWSTKKRADWGEILPPLLRSNLGLVS